MSQFDGQPAGDSPPARRRRVGAPLPRNFRLLGGVPADRYDRRLLRMRLDIARAAVMRASLAEGNQWL